MKVGIGARSRTPGDAAEQEFAQPGMAICAHHEQVGLGAAAIWTIASSTDSPAVRWFDHLACTPWRASVAAMPRRADGVRVELDILVRIDDEHLISRRP